MGRGFGILLGWGVSSCLIKEFGWGKLTPGLLDQTVYLFFHNLWFNFNAREMFEH
jgi:hypothetical protein